MPFWHFLVDNIVRKIHYFDIVVSGNSRELQMLPGWITTKVGAYMLPFSVSEAHIIDNVYHYILLSFQREVEASRLRNTPSARG